MSTALRPSEIERSSGGGDSGAATNAVSSRATAPRPHSSHFKALRGVRISHFDMMIPPRDAAKPGFNRELCTTEYMKPQVPKTAICGGNRNPYLVRDGKKADSIIRNARTRHPD